MRCRSLWVRAVAIVSSVTTLVLGVAGNAAASPAADSVSAAELPPGMAGGLQKFVFGLPEFDKAYIQNACVPADGTSTAVHKGWNINRYMADYTHSVGELMYWSQVKAGAKPGEALKLRWSDPNGTITDVVTKDSPSLGIDLSTYWARGSLSQHHCADYFARWGTPDANSPWGFAFVTKPDKASAQFIQQNLAAHPISAQTPPGADKWASPQDLQRRYSSELWTSSFPARGSECAKGDSPFCANAMWLNCFQGDGDADKADLDRCYQWNLSVARLLLAVQEAMLIAAGTVGDPGATDAQKAAAGQEGADWVLGAYVAGSPSPAVKILKLVAAMAVVAAVVLAPGWVVAGAFVFLAVKLTQAVAAVIKCVADEGDTCIASWMAKAMVSGLELIPTAAAANAFSISDLNGPLHAFWAKLILLSASLALLVYVIALCLAAFRLRLGEMLIATGGLVQFGILSALGLTFIGMLVTLSTQIADYISGASTGGLQALTLKLTTVMQAAIAGSAGVAGILLVAVVCLVGAVAALIVAVLFMLQKGWIFLAITLIALQIAGRAGWDTPRRWAGRGMNLLWVVLLAKPMVALVFSVAVAVLGQGTGFADLISGVGLLCMAVSAPALAARHFSLHGQEYGDRLAGFTGFGGSRSSGAALAGGGAMSAAGLAMGTMRRNAPTPGGANHGDGASSGGGRSSGVGGMSVAGAAARGAMAAAGAMKAGVESAGGALGSAHMPSPATLLPRGLGASSGSAASGGDTANDSGGSGGPRHLVGSSGTRAHVGTASTGPTSHDGIPPRGSTTSPTGPTAASPGPVAGQPQPTTAPGGFGTDTPTPAPGVPGAPPAPATGAGDSPPVTPRPVVPPVCRAEDVPRPGFGPAPSDGRW